MSEADNVYRSILRARVNGALTMARAAGGITHNGMKGRVREILIRELFRPLLPADIGITSGQIATCKSQKLSREHDIIIFDGSILPAMSFDGSTAIIPIESVLYTIEVKSTLSRSELEGAHRSAKELAEFDYLPGRSFRDGVEIQHGVANLNSTLFALNSDLSPSMHGEVKRYKGIYVGDVPHLKALCVAGSGYWYEVNGSWIKFGNEAEGDDVLAFIGGVMNTYNMVRATRGFQKIGEYLIKVGAEFQSFPSGTTPTINVKCEGCEDKAVVSFPSNVDVTQDWTQGFVAPQACPKCAGKLIAPPGTYSLTDGLFVLNVAH